MPTSAGHDRQSGRDADTLIRKRSWEPAREPPERTLSLDAGLRRTARRRRLHATNQFEPGSKFGGYLWIRRFRRGSGAATRAATPSDNSGLAPTRPAAEALLLRITRTDLNGFASTEPAF